MVLSDLDIGMNDWMVPELEWDESYVPDRGKVLTAEQLEEMEQFLSLPGRRWRRYSVPVLAGRASQGRIFHAGFGHTKLGAYTEDSAEYQEVVDRLLVKWETARSMVPEAGNSLFQIQQGRRS